MINRTLELEEVVGCLVDDMERIVNVSRGD